MKPLNQIQILAVNGGELTVDSIFAVAGIVTGLAVAFNHSTMHAACLFTGYAIGGGTVLISAGVALGIVEPWNPTTSYMLSLSATTLASSAIIHLC